MADNPFDPKHFGLLAAIGAERYGSSLLDFVKPSTSEAKPSSSASPYPLFGSGLGGMFGLTAPVKIEDTSVNTLASLLMGSSPPFSAPSTPLTSSLGSPSHFLVNPEPSQRSSLYTPPQRPKPIAPEIKRRAFFSFHFDDIMRVNNVRNAWKIDHPNSATNRSFYDSSLWEARKLTKPDSIKQLIRLGVLGTSAVCVLAGSMTWDRRWIKYEIARAIIDGRGLLTVHLNSINHHRTKGPHPRGLNPLAHMGLAKLQPSKSLPVQYYLCEMMLVRDGYGSVVEQWRRYSDYTQPVKKPAWLTDPSVDRVMPLSTDAAEYDYELDHGHRNIGNWIDKAAKQAGR